MKKKKKTMKRFLLFLETELSSPKLNISGSNLQSLKNKQKNLL